VKEGNTTLHPIGFACHFRTLATILEPACTVAHWEMIIPFSFFYKFYKVVNCSLFNFHGIHTLMHWDEFQLLLSTFNPLFMDSHRCFPQIQYLIACMVHRLSWFGGNQVHGFDGIRDLGASKPNKSCVLELHFAYFNAYFPMQLHF